MAEIQYTSNDLVKTRFLISPVSVLSRSAKVFYNPQAYPLYSNWISYVHEALDSIDLPVMADFQRGAASCLPSILAPFPIHQAPTIDDQLEQIASFSEDIVEESIDFQLRMDPPESDLRKYNKQPLLLKERVVDELQVYWKHVIKPHWKQIHATLESDILQRSRKLAADGYERTIMELDSRITVVAGRMNINDSRVQITMDLAGTGIMLIPTLFDKKTRISISPMIAPGMSLQYVVNGSANWRNNRSIEPSDAMNLMLGEHRARLLFQLQRPITTLELAGTLYLTTSAVSQQLKQLYEADLVSKHRLGKRVYYKLSERGEGLLNIFESKID